MLKLKYTILYIFFVIPILSFGQQQKLKFSEARNYSMHEIIKIIEGQTNYSFVYQPGTFNSDKLKNIRQKEFELQDIINLVFPKEEYQIKIQDKQILIKSNTPSNPQSRLEKPTKWTISGYLTDASTGEAIIGGAIQVANTATGTITNNYGYYSLTYSGNNIEIQISSIGFERKSILVEGIQSQTLNVKLKPESTELDEAVIVSENYAESILSTNMGTKKLTTKEVKEIPSLAGESDLIKAIQMLPGVSTKGEGATNYMVRGGSGGQNLILLDEATVYNPSHLMGFFSVFNPDAINNLTFYKNDFPSKYGNRLSSVLDIQMKDGNSEKLSLSGGLGTISSRILLEGPIQKNKSSFIISGRRTYADLFLLLSPDEYTRKTSLYFYDLNVKTNYKINDKNKLFLSGYFGKDAIDIRALQYNIFWGNATTSLRWNHIFNNKLFSNTTLLYSQYNYEINFPREDAPLNWLAGIKEGKFKSDYTYYLNSKNKFWFGVSSSLQWLNPGSSSENVFEPVPDAIVNLNSSYIQYEQSITEKLLISYGLRFNWYNLLGPYTEIQVVDNQYEETNNTSSIVYDDYGFEPKLGIRYLTSENSALKINYSRTSQYLNQLSNSSTSFSVFDVWYPVNNNIAPSRSDNYNAGWFVNLKQNQFKVNTEVFYRDMKNQLDFADHAQMVMNKYIENNIKVGNAEAYGAELSIEKNKGNLKGMVSYSYSRVFYTITEINNGKEYPASHDQPHKINFFGSYKVSKRLTASANWTYSTGSAFSIPTETYLYEDYVVPVYGEKNNDRLPNYHRLDLSVTLNSKDKPGKKNNGSWIFSVYNAYARLNALTVFVGPKMSDINIIQDENNIVYQKLALFSAIPSITYNFKF